MKRIQEDPDREDRIQNEAVADAYDEEEQAMGWYYYIEDKLHRPFKAKCISKRIISPLEQGEQIEVRGMAPEEECMKEVFVEKRHRCQAYTVDREPQKQISKIVSNLDLSNV